MVRFEQVSSQTASKLLTTARALGSAEARGARAQPLRGKNLALLAQGPGPSAELFVAAVEQLGAKASKIGADVLAFDDEHELQRMARVLDRLYDGVECQGVPSERVRQLSELATMPVFDGVACDSHPTARLADQLDDCSRADARRWILQAALLQTML
ncbi:MAG TPA: ornithine carbamoyltransferase [Burkholderiaceae bacterium]|nr:ornithine carbamoyltransferase [Burkholderiaceae bacterium]